MIPEELDELLERLQYIAELDGIITEEEKNLLDTVRRNVEKFKQAYTKAWEDNVITLEEKEDLRSLWKNILIETSKAAVEDQVYSKDELSIFFRVFTTLIRNLD